MKKNTILSILAVLLSCLSIPAGVSHDLSVLEIAVNMAVIIAALLVAGLNNENFFKPTQESELGHYMLMYLVSSSGLMSMLGTFGEELWLRILGAVLLVLGAVYCRIITRKTE